MTRGVCRWAWLLVPALLVGCGGKSKAKSADDETTGGDPAAGMSDGSDSGESGSGEGSTEREYRSKPPPSLPDDYSLTQNDCNVLTDVYEKLLRQQEMAKLEGQKFKPAELERAKANVEKVVEKGAEGWQKNCDGIVNTVQPRGRLQCAFDARELERFTGCWDGKFDGETPAPQ